MVIALEKLPHMSADQLRVAVNHLLQSIATKDNALSQQAQELTFKQATIDKLTHENAYLKRLKFAAQSERFNAEQGSLLEETLDEDLQAVSDEIEQLTPAQPVTREKQQPKRQVLPANLPRTDIHHEPDSTTCQCGCQLKRIGEDVPRSWTTCPACSA